MWNVISWILVGLVAGSIAKAIHPGKDPGGCLTTMVIGILGAFIGGFLSSWLFNKDVTGFNFTSLLISVGGSLILLIVYRMIMKNRG